MSRPVGSEATGRKARGWRAATLSCPRLLLLPLLLLSFLLPAARVAAQAAQVTADPGPHYVGEAIAIRVTAVGFEEDPAPQAQVAPTSGGTLELVGVSPSVSQSITIVNGQMTRTREVTHVFQFRFVPSRVGELKIGPFRIQQGSRQAAVPVVRMRVQGVPSSDDLAVAVELPKGPVFVGERVPVVVSFKFENGLQKNLLEYQLRVPLFDDPAFRFLDSGASEGDLKVTLATAAGALELRGTSREHVEKGKRFTTISVERQMVPLVAGVHAIPKAFLSAEEGVRFRRDFFGGRRATQVRRWRAESEAAELEVAQIPGQKQPPSFGGAIGRGITLDVTADRTVVQVGDPITLTLRLQGEGLETAALPALDAEGLLPAVHFRVAGDSPRGQVDGDTKQFTATVRVLSEEVTEIPGLAYSWFDPDTRSFQMTHSRPIALSVRSAEIIGAEQVQIGGDPGDADTLAAAAAEPGSDRGAAAAKARSFALTGADLAIEREPGTVLGGARGWGGDWLPRTLYGGSVLLLALSYWDRRRRDVDPERTRRRGVLQSELDRVRGAGSLAPAEGVVAISQALRRMLQEAPEASADDLDALLGECDARSYAPGGAVQSLDAAFLERATALAERIAHEAR